MHGRHGDAGHADPGEDQGSGRGAGKGVRTGGEGRPGRRRLGVDRRREELMAVALELFSRYDADEVSIEDVAMAAGASRALVYHYFGGKQELYVAALRSAAARLEERLRGAGDGSPLQELTRGLTRYFDFVEEHAAGFAALLRGGPANRTGEVGEIVDGVRRRLFTMILKQMGVADPSPVLRVTVRSWIASVETAGLDWLENRDVERSALEALLIDQMVALLGAAAAHDPTVRLLMARLAGQVRE
ncbi:TetR/AcrR family transcriptional regulator [Thermopolyspora sp. NPDC052614]|uniref:TetR/AcrR family transcriptional regulator n=1 Tax=Thermopolyspora sp. NPDC052614 TaxID=3155682 RepID=UPI0034148A48